MRVDWEIWRVSEFGRILLSVEEFSDSVHNWVCYLEFFMLLGCWQGDGSFSCQGWHESVHGVPQCWQGPWSCVLHPRGENPPSEYITEYFSVGCVILTWIDSRVAMSFFAGLPRSWCGSLVIGLENTRICAKVCHGLQVSQPTSQPPGIFLFLRGFQGFSGAKLMLLLFFVGLHGFCWRITWWILFWSKSSSSGLQVNNAGVTLHTPWYTDEGVGGSAQVLCHYFLKFLRCGMVWSSINAWIWGNAIQYHQYFGPSSGCDMRSEFPFQLNSVGDIIFVKQQSPPFFLFLFLAHLGDVWESII
jgi:hypothetical protein